MSTSTVNRSFPGFHNAFYFVDTYGLPLVFQMDVAERRGLQVALDSFVRDAVLAGWKFEKAIAACREALTERHGAQIGHEMTERLSRGMKLRFREYWPTAA